MASAPKTDEDQPKAARALSDRGRRRREAILAAATTEFLGKGYEAASIRTIIREGGGGSADAVYRIFGSKAGLFQAVLSELMQRHYQGFFREDNLERDPAAELFEFGFSYVNTVMADDALRFYRVMISSRESAPEMTQIFWDSGFGAVVRRLEAYLARQTERGVLNVPSPQEAAVQFMELAKAGMHIRLLCTGERPSQDEVITKVRAAVDVFLAAYASRRM